MDTNIEPRHLVMTAAQVCAILRRTKDPVRRAYWYDVLDAVEPAEEFLDVEELPEFVEVEELPQQPPIFSGPGNFPGVCIADLADYIRDVLDGSGDPARLRQVRLPGWSLEWVTALDETTGCPWPVDLWIERFDSETEDMERSSWSEFVETYRRLDAPTLAHHGHDCTSFRPWPFVSGLFNFLNGTWKLLRYEEDYDWRHYGAALDHQAFWQCTADAEIFGAGCLDSGLL